MPGVNSTDTLNVHTLAIQVPIRRLTRNRATPSGVAAANAVIGVSTSASRQAIRGIQMSLMRGHEAHRDVGVTARPAVLELGADVGAAVIYTTAALDGAEIEIKPARGDWDGTHTAVRRRPGEPGCEPIFAALFYGLAAGTYDLRLRHQSQSIQVCGGRVTEDTWYPGDVSHQA